MKCTNEHYHSISWRLPAVCLPHRLLPGIRCFDIEAVLISIFPEAYSQEKKTYHSKLPYDAWISGGLLLRNMSAILFIALIHLGKKNKKLLEYP